MFFTIFTLNIYSISDKKINSFLLRTFYINSYIHPSVDNKLRKKNLLSNVLYKRSKLCLVMFCINAQMFA